MKPRSYPFTSEHIRRYITYLKDQERAAHTIQKYTHDLTALLGYLDGQPLTKAALIGWKEQLTAAHAPTTVNSMLAAANSFLAFAGRKDLSVRPLKLQRALFRDEGKELTRAEYVRLVEAARRQGNQRLSLVLQTICATGIRVSELRFITAEAVALGRAEIVNKGKRRTVFLPERLRRLLNAYLKTQKRPPGRCSPPGRGGPWTGPTSGGT